jgi:two-component system cell cycle response regulator DivK
VLPDRRPLVLLVDNHADNREMYALYLRLRGFCVIACADSRIVVDLALTWMPDIILLELRMNGLNGLDVVARLKREPSIAHIPVVALTASVLSFEQAAAMAAGFTALLAKPCLPDEVSNAIGDILEASRMRDRPLAM